MPTKRDRWLLTLAAAGVWLPGLLLLRFVAHFVTGRNGSGASALVGFGVAFVLCLVCLRLVWWLPYRSRRAWVWASVLALSICGMSVWVGTALANSATVELGNDLLWSALLGLGTGAPLAVGYGALGGFFIGLAARAGRAHAGPSERPVSLVASCGVLILAGAIGTAYLVLHDTWPGPW